MYEGLRPPILDNLAPSIPFIESVDKSLDSSFFLSINIRKDELWGKIEHFQVTIKEKESGEIGIAEKFSPDRATLFIARSTVSLIKETATTATIRIPYYLFSNGKPKKNTFYNIQVRYGLNSLWEGAGTGVDGAGFNNFAAWRANSISSIPSKFGEWSNIQQVFCHPPFYSSFIVTTKETFAPQLSFLYQGQREDPIDTIEVIYRFKTLHSEQEKKIKRRSSATDNEIFVWNETVQIAPIVPIYFELVAVTKNNTYIKHETTFDPRNISIHGILGTFIPTVLEGEEIDDGCIYHKIKIRLTEEVDYSE